MIGGSFNSFGEEQRNESYKIHEVDRRCPCLVLNVEPINTEKKADIQAGFGINGRRRNLGSENKKPNSQHDDS